MHDTGSSRRDSRMAHARNELYDDMISHTERLMQDFGIDQNVSEQVACALTDHLANNWAGQVFSFPKDHLNRLSQRDLEMYHQHRGDFAETARKWGMTDRGARKVIERVIKRLVKQNQGDLFGADTDPDNSKP